MRISTPLWANDVWGERIAFISLGKKEPTKRPVKKKKRAK